MTMGGNSGARFERLDTEQASKLWNHIRALEAFAEQKAEISEDEKCRKEIIKADGFDNNIVAAIIKRRKNGHGQTLAADSLLNLYEQALEEQGVMPLEQTKAAAPEAREQRTSIEEASSRIHGDDALTGADAAVIPPKPEVDPVEAAKRALAASHSERVPNKDPF